MILIHHPFLLLLFLYHLFWPRDRFAATTVIASIVFCMHTNAAVKTLSLLIADRQIDIVLAPSKTTRKTTFNTEDINDEDPGSVKQGGPQLVAKE
jgi:hypothetical protein